MKSILLILAVLLAATLRLYKLDSYPVSLSWDEVAIGYNAYSISKTGADEYGTRWPLLFESFNDYKLPGYIYTDVLFINFFGLSEFTVRLPSAIFGIIAVLAIYFLTKQLFQKFKTNFSLFGFQFSIAHISALIMAISPWHLQFSRTAFEANAALTLVIIGITLLIYGLRNKFAALISLPILTTSIYFYYSPRVFVPMIVIFFLIIFKSEIARSFKYYLYGLVLSILILIPITIQILSPRGLKRVREVSIFTDQSLIVDYVDARVKNSNIISSLFLNRRIPLAFEFLRNYFSHLSPGFLFFGDDPNPRHRSAFHGNLYIFEIPLILLGIWLILKYKDAKIRYFLLVWLLLAPIPAALSRETPHGLRSLLLLPPLLILVSLGASEAVKRWGRVKLVFGTVILVFFVNYLYSYYLLYPRKDSLPWAYGYKEMFKEVLGLESNFDRVIVTGSYWKPYIFYLFYSQKSSAYNKIDPRFYQFQGSQQSIGKYRFGIAGWDSGGKDLDETSIDSLKSGKTLLVISPGEFQDIDTKERFKKLSTVSDYSGKQDVFLIGEWQ